MTDVLKLSSTRVIPRELFRAARQLRVMQFAEDGHFCSWARAGVLEAKGDCVFYIFSIFGLSGMWPPEWQGQLPLEIRQVRLKCGSRYSTLDDFPIIAQFLEANTTLVDEKPKDGDIVLMRWGNREGAPHHVALWAGEGFYHLPYGGVSGWQKSDPTWETKIMQVWRLSAVIQGD